MEDRPTDVHFSCQRCCQPLRLDHSLNPIDKDFFFDLISHHSNGIGSGIGTGLSAATDANNDIRKVVTLPDIDEDKSPSNVAVEGQSLNIPTSSNLNSSSPRKTNSDVIYKVVQPIRKVEKCATDCDYSVINDPNSSSANLTSSSIIHSSLLSNFDQSTVDKSKDLKLQIQLFDILSDQSDIDHPLCEECADFVIKQMDHHLKLLENECNDYNEYLQQMTVPEVTSDKEIDDLRAQLQSMQVVQASKISELKELNVKQKRVEDELERRLNEFKKQKADEDRYWHEYNNIKFSLYQCEEENQTLENKLRYAKEYYNKLKRANVFNSTFHIWYSGPFGTINGFRMGRTPNMQVDWHEINAGWGQCALLLSSLSKKISLTFQRYKIVPYGNYSFIESLDDKSKQLPLYTSGGIKYYFHQKFEQAMIAFLDCLQQFNDEAHRQDSDFKLPYEMDSKGNLAEKGAEKYSIRISVNTEEKWTKALKFMLTNLKWALAWVVMKH